MPRRERALQAPASRCARSSCTQEGPQPPTHEAIAHHAAKPLEGVAVSVGEVELRQLGVAEQGAQGGLWATRGPLGHCRGWGEQGVAGGGGCRGPEAGLTSSCCGMSCMISFWGHWSVSLRGAESQGSPHPGRLPAAPTLTPVCPPLLTGSRPGSRRPGKGGPASVSRWSLSRVGASVVGAGGVTGHNPDAPACPTHRGQPSAPAGTHRRPATAHLLPLEDAAPGQQLVAEPVLTYSQAPEGKTR